MLEVRDPADVRSVVAEVPAMTAAEVAAAYDRARTAFEGWRRANPLDRAAVLARAADLIRARAEDGAVILVRENGKTLAEARVEVTKTADFLDYYASFARQPWGELLSDARPGTSTSVRVEPVGVVLAICPWNDPLHHPRPQARPGPDRRQCRGTEGGLADAGHRALGGRRCCSRRGCPRACCR